MTKAARPISRPAARRRRGKNRRVRSLRGRLPRPRALGTAAWGFLRRGARVYAAVGIVCASLGAGAGFVHWLRSSPRFALARIDVSGATERSVAFIETLAAEAGARRIRDGERAPVNIFRLDTTAVARALERDTWIARATVARRLPNRLAIDIVEHSAAAIAELDKLYLVDQRGRAFRSARIARGEGAGLPVITGITAQQYKDDPTNAQAAIARAIAIAHIYAERAARPALSDIHIDPRRGFLVRTYERALSVRLGEVRDDRALRDRLDAFDATWAALDERERTLASTIYLDNETNPNRITVGF